VAHCPESNMKLASGVARWFKCCPGALPSAWELTAAPVIHLDLFHEMDTAAKLHKVHLLDPTVMDAQTVLRMATIEGAKVLQMEQKIGSWNRGKRPM